MSAAPPRLLHVFSTFVPAGPEMRTVRLIEAFGRTYDHAIVAMDGRTDASERLPADAPVRILDSPPKAGTPATVRRLVKLLRREKPDLLLTYNWGAFDAVIATRIVGLRAVLHHEDGFNADEAAQFKSRRIWMRRGFLPGVHRVIVPSHRLEDIARTLWRLSAAKIERVPNGVHLDRFEPRDGNPELRRRLGVPTDALVVGYVGHLRPEKNPARLLRACATIAPQCPVHVLVLGEGPERATLEKLAAEPALAGRVHLVGHRDDTAEHYRAMDVFALSSDTEQLPVALLEAMASELPVASTAVGDVASVLPPEQAPYVVPLLELHATAEALGAALLALAGDPALRARLGRANRARASVDFTFESMLERYRALYTAALSAGRR